MRITVDTSALVAVVFGEPEADTLGAVMLHSAGDCLVSAVSLVEAGIVVEARQGSAASQDLRLLLELIGAEVASVDAPTAWAAIAAWQRFGKGRHPAGLNLGGCFSYALAKVSGTPLLFKGDDFRQTDVTEVAVNS